MSKQKSFDDAMRQIFRADPEKVKAEIDAEIQANIAERKARGERKRGRKPKPTSASDRVSDVKG